MICLVPRRAVLKNFYLAIMVCSHCPSFCWWRSFIFHHTMQKLHQPPGEETGGAVQAGANGTFDIGEERSGICEIDGLFVHFREMQAN